VPQNHRVTNQAKSAYHRAEAGVHHVSGIPNDLSITATLLNRVARTNSLNEVWAKQGVADYHPIFISE